jgi:microcystin-dependent protein
MGSERVKDDDNDYFLGEIVMLAGGGDDPRFLPCDGRLISVQANQALFAVIGATFGGDGKTNFALPDLRGRLAVGAGHPRDDEPWMMGEQRGQEQVALTLAQLPIHSHALLGSTDQATSGAIGADSVLASTAPGVLPYSDSRKPIGNVAALSPKALAPNTPAGAPHDNVMPTLVLAHHICVAGVYPAKGA